MKAKEWKKVRDLILTASLVVDSVKFDSSGYDRLLVIEADVNLSLRVENRFIVDLVDRIFTVSYSLFNNIPSRRSYRPKNASLRIDEIGSSWFVNKSTLEIQNFLLSFSFQTQQSLPQSI